MVHYVCENVIIPMTGWMIRILNTLQNGGVSLVINSSKCISVLLLRSTYWEDFKTRSMRKMDSTTTTTVFERRSHIRIAVNYSTTVKTARMGLDIVASGTPKHVMQTTRSFQDHSVIQRIFEVSVSPWLDYVSLLVTQSRVTIRWVLGGSKYLVPQ